MSKAMSHGLGPCLQGDTEGSFIPLNPFHEHFQCPDENIQTQEKSSVPST